MKQEPGPHVGAGRDGRQRADAHQGGAGRRPARRRRAADRSGRRRDRRAADRRRASSRASWTRPRPRWPGWKGSRRHEHGRRRVPRSTGWFTMDGKPRRRCSGAAAPRPAATSSRRRSRVSRNPARAGRGARRGRAVARGAGCGRGRRTTTSRRRRTWRPTRSCRTRWSRSSSPRSRWSCSARSPPASTPTTCAVGLEVELALGHAVRGRRPRVRRVELEAGHERERTERTGRGRGPRGRACTRGASGAATSSSTASSPRRPRSPTPASSGATSSSSPAPTRCATATPATSPARRSRRRSAGRARRSASSYAACASGATALNAARAQILAGLCDVALVVGADTTPKGFLAPNAGERGDDPDWLRFRLLGATNPTYFALYARRRMELFGATPDDFAKVKVKNAAHGLANPNARYRKEVTSRTSRRVADRGRPAAPARHLRDDRRRRRGRRVEHGVREVARGAVDPVRVAAVSTVTPTLPEHRSSRCRTSRPTRPRRCAAPTHDVPRLRSPQRAYEQAGLGPDDLDLAEVYDLSTALELDWYENIGLCKPGEAEQLLQRRRHHASADASR